jgi:ubiquinone/menaquinone biosynthesis C-methylase UbiE
MTAARGKFTGVTQIIKYNTPYYVVGLCAILGIGLLLWSQLLSRSVRAVLVGASFIAIFWTLSSLLASYYVYDYVGVTSWSWLPGMLLFRPRQWLNVHAGLDESTNILAQLFPGSSYMVLDVYDSRAMTEPSIAKARRLSPSDQPATSSKLDALPLPDCDRDTAFLLFTAHEIRHRGRRMQFLQEVARVMTDSGQLLLVEHLRDWKNFVAYGPGFLHFYSSNEWLRVAREAGLTVERECPVTPFVRCFVMRKAAA